MTEATKETKKSKSSKVQHKPQPFKAEVTEVLRLVVNSLYSHKEIFLRELISNASDALDKLRFRGLSEPDLLPQGTTLKIQLAVDRSAKTLTISDNGIGMTAAELAENLGTIAHSGTREFLKKVEAARASQQSGVQLIGQFGVGFYSSYLVADRVDVISRAAGSEEANRWSSDAKETFTIDAAERDSQGTSIVLHLKDDSSEFLENYRLRNLILRYSDYIGNPIELKKEEGDEFEVVNQASALWRRSAKEITDEQYNEFYKHLTHDWEEPLARRHFQVEGTQMFAGILFLPARPPFDLFDPNAAHGVRLHVKRVFVMDNCDDLVPRYLRFIRGVVDSEDLPLNVSREILQDSSLVRVIKKQVTNHALSMIEELEQESPEKFKRFWTEFGAVLKEGLHFDGDNRERISKLVRFESSAEQGLTSLETYVGRMKPDQSAIYYAAGPSRSMLEASPHIEQLKSRGYEVLFMTDPVDPFAVDGLREFDGKPLVSAMAEDLKLPEEAAVDPEEKKKRSEAAEPLIEAFKTTLADKVSEVRVSSRLGDSPVCLVIPEGGLSPHIERLMRARNVNVPASKRILELNLEHPVIGSIQKLVGGEASGQINEWVEVLYDQALIAEGSPIDDPSRFARRLTKLLEQAVASPAR
jgi:molecular chaperone HtpG